MSVRHKILRFKERFVLCSTCFLFLLISTLAFPFQGGAQEEILSFQSSIDIQADSALQVVETISVRSTGEKIKRGIYRDFPTRIETQKGFVEVDFRVQKVLRDGKVEPYIVETVSGGKRIRIGNANVFLKKGVYTYTIHYRTGKQLSFLADHDELYWNVTGDRWDFPIRKAIARVKLPVPVTREGLQVTGYTGVRGSREQKFTSQIEQDGTVVFETTEVLPQGHGFTAVVGWPKGIVQEPIPEKIRNFRANISVKPDGRLDVVETFEADLYGENLSGSFRRILPKAFKLIGPFRKNAELSGVSAMREDAPIISSISERGGGESWEIHYGVDDTKAETKSYRLEYTVGPLHSTENDRYLIEWNVTGQHFTVPIQNASVVVRHISDPVGEKGYILQVSNSTESQIQQSTKSSGEVRLFWPGERKGRQGYPIVIRLAKDAFESAAESGGIKTFLQDNREIVEGSKWVLVLCLYYLVVWFLVGRDPDARTTIPRWDLPEGISPAGARFLMKMGFDMRAVAASMVSLAIQGRIKIDRDGEDHYVIEHLESDGSVKFSDEEALLRTLFKGRGRDYLVVSQDNSKKLKKAVEALKNSLRKRHLKTHFRKNSMVLVPGWIVSLYGAWQTLVVIPPGSAFTTVVLLVLAYPFLRAVSRQYARSQTGKAGFLGGIGRLFALLSCVVTAVIICVVLASFVLAVNIGLVFFAVHIFLNYLFYHLIKAPTLRGRELMDNLEGLRMYIESAEEETVAQLEQSIGKKPPAFTIDLYEQYLPYAVALGIESVWTARFLKAFTAETLDELTASRYDYRWFSGNDSEYFSSFGDSFSTQVTSASLPPRATSSGGGFSSGFGGGGFSGGGGGGGGGGGW